MSTTKRRAPAKLAAPVVKANAKRPTKTTIDETKTAVSGTEAMQTSQIDTIEISSDEASDEDVSDDEDDSNNINTGNQKEGNDSAEEAGKDAATTQTNGKPGTSIKEEMAGSDEDDNDNDNDEPTSPSFGELLRGTAEPIDLTAMLRQPSAAAAATANTASSSAAAAIVAERTAIVPPTHQSLVTVLSQALATDDTDLLESCLHTTDLPTIRNTIERLDSALAGALLAKLAARLHRRPGRAGTLMTWVQWTLVAHGGALASQGKVVQSLSGLQKVLAERARGLNSLLALKGKLDILEGQMELRRKMQQHGSGSGSKQARPDDNADADNGNAGAADDDDDNDEDDDDDAIYVEGEENDASLAANGASSRRRHNRGIDSEDEDEDGGALANGVVGMSEDEEEGDSDDGAEDSDGADEEPLDEDEVNFDDVDESMGEGEDEESDAEAAPPAKLQKVAKPFGKKK
ncbi:U3 small nucleolar RNA-associated protein 5 [Escovopsis weberi]|uniref:U3 small nucleolar RNA-associated protein 5 n=1 Tax=Escovopsis weberi TaxID=150374 RepID=A0A0N0RTE3_ESCWE|nr:U3 small nucleolar RNA-associated protein 5 [Escovopsis weberi]